MLYHGCFSGREIDNTCLNTSTADDVAVYHNKYKYKTNTNTLLHSGLQDVNNMRITYDNTMYIYSGEFELYISIIYMRVRNLPSPI